MVNIRNLRKDYGEGKSAYPALRGLSFTIASGEFAAIMGPSGCGKSTLLNILGLLDRPSGGRYSLAGKAAERLSDLERTMLRRRAIGFVFQAFNLLPRLSALENVCLPMSYEGVPPAESRQRALELLARVGLDGKEHKSPLELSGGERQRVGIARALANRPGLVLADEPTGNLDSRTSAGIMDLFRELHAEGKTMLLVTHDRGIAEQADRILHIQDGVISGEERK